MLDAVVVARGRSGRGARDAGVYAEAAVLAVSPYDFACGSLLGSGVVKGEMVDRMSGKSVVGAEKTDRRVEALALAVMGHGAVREVYEGLSERGSGSVYVQTVALWVATKSVEKMAEAPKFGAEVVQRTQRWSEDGHRTW